MEKIIEILKKFEEERKKKIVEGKWVNINKSKEEAVADCFYPCAKEILCNGYFLVNNKYIIDLGAIELYYHEEGEGEDRIKDYAMYHIPERYISPKIEGVVKLEKTLPYFVFGSLNLHQSGVDITFEKTPDNNEKYGYRASFLIRAYRVLEAAEGGKYPDNPNQEYDTHSTHIFDDMFYEGISWYAKDKTTIKWIEFNKGESAILLPNCPRLNVVECYFDSITKKVYKKPYFPKNYQDNNKLFFKKKDKIYKYDQKPWLFKLSGVKLPNTIY